VWEVVRNKGFTPREAQVVAVGEVFTAEGKLRLKVAGINQTYDLVTEPQAQELTEEIKKHSDRAVVLEGTVPPPKDKAGPTLIRVKSVKPVEEEEN
jgi:RecJ-like exonuclease